jgi:hypothetical protein
MAIILAYVLLRDRHNVLRNETQGKSTSIQINAPSGTTLVGNCAEWIVERHIYDICQQKGAIIIPFGWSLSESPMCL